MNGMLQDLYDNEINFSIAGFWDAGFHVKLGDDVNGFPAAARVATLEAAVQWLQAHAIERYPDSAFAKKYGA